MIGPKWSNMVQNNTKYKTGQNRTKQFWKTILYSNTFKHFEQIYSFAKIFIDFF